MDLAPLLGCRPLTPNYTCARMARNSFETRLPLITDFAVYRCPHCNKRIEMHTVQDFATRFGKREAFNCPFCQTRLNWSRGPFLVSNIAMWGACLSILMPFLELWSFGVAMAVFPILLGLAAVASMFKKLEFDTD